MILCIVDPVNSAAPQKGVAFGSDRRMAKVSEAREEMMPGSAPIMPGSAPVIIDKTIGFEEKPLITHAYDLLGN